jgi:[ribosomal protein S5]-alanine N-acetyltransferase
MSENVPFLKKLPTLETKRLILRDVQISDAEGIYAYSSNPIFYRSMGHKIPQSVEETREKIEKSLSLSHKMPHNWIVVLKSDNKVIGDCGFNVYRPDNRRAEVNYAIDPAFWNRGLATEAVLRIIRFGFEDLHLNRIQAICHPDNQSSQRVIQKAGMTCEGLLRDYIWFEEGPLDMKMHSILKEEWLNTRSN